MDNEPLTLTTLFIDMNSYFASVEQQHQPALRGQPVAVVPVMADTTCCIAASVEAKAFGIKTGTSVRDAKRLCRQLRVVQARHELYVRTHHALRAAVESCMPIDGVHSIDEMSCRLAPSERNVDCAVAKGRQIKNAIRRHVGEYLRCSVGISSNRFLAKIAADMQKPDGLTVVEPHEVPEKLFTLELDDFPGIGPRMLRRMHAAGIHTVEQMYALPATGLARIWNSVQDSKFWYLIRGIDLPETPTRRRTISHSHVLAPELRSEGGSYAVLTHLLSKAASRMRRLGYCARRLSAFVACLPKGGWRAEARLQPSDDTRTLQDAFAELWSRRMLPGQPLQVGVVLSDLVLRNSATLPLFPDERRQSRISHAMDQVNGRLRRNAIYLASACEARGSAPMRIAFNRIPDLVDPDWDSQEQFESLVEAIRPPEWIYDLEPASEAEF